MNPVKGNRSRAGPALELPTQAIKPDILVTGQYLDLPSLAVSIRACHAAMLRHHEPGNKRKYYLRYKDAVIGHLNLKDE